MYPWIVNFNQEANYQYQFESDYYDGAGYPVCKLHGYFAISDCLVDRASHIVTISGVTEWFEEPVTADIYSVFEEVDNGTTITSSTLSFVNTLTSASPGVCVVDFDGDIKSSIAEDMAVVLDGCAAYTSSKYSGSHTEFEEAYVYRYYVSDEIDDIVAEDPDDLNNNNEQLTYAEHSVDYDKQVFAVQPAEYNYFYHLDIPDSLSQVVGGDDKLLYPLLPSIYVSSPVMIPHLEYFKPDGSTLVLTHSFLPPFSAVGTYPYLHSGDEYVEMVVTNPDQVQQFVYEGPAAEIRVDFEADIGNGTLVLYTAEGVTENYYFYSSFSRTVETFTLGDEAYNLLELALMTEESEDENRAKFYSIKVNDVEQDLESMIGGSELCIFYGYEGGNDYLPVYYPGESDESFELKYSSLDWPEHRRVSLVVRFMSGDKIIAVAEELEDMFAPALDDASYLARGSLDMKWGYGGESYIDGLPLNVLVGFGTWRFYGARFHSDQLVQAWLSVSSTAVSELTAAADGKYDISPHLIDNALTVEPTTMSPAVHSLDDNVTGAAYFTSVDIYKEQYNSGSGQWEYVLYDSVPFDYEWYSLPESLAGYFSFPVTTDYFYTKESVSYRCKFVFNYKSLPDGGAGYPMFLARVASPHEHLCFKDEESLVRSLCNMKAFDATGRVAISSGSNIVTGTGTEFLSELSIGDYVKIGTGSETHEVCKINSNTEIELLTDCDSTLSNQYFRIYPSGLYDVGNLSGGKLYFLTDATLSKAVEYPEFSSYPQFDSIVSSLESWGSSSSEPAVYFGSYVEPSEYSYEIVTPADFRLMKLYIAPVEFSGLVFDVYIDDEYIRTVTAALETPYVNSGAREYASLGGDVWAFMDEVELLELQITAPIMKLGKLLLDDQLQARIINPYKLGFLRHVTNGGGGSTM